ncbi:type I restriction-modification system subunit M N-terminal domain-containing protein [Methanosarcina horonobensis]|nr:type I restriction-modification system subunit M N-terminal domain-containing protein [Methanosarcina horonobensis]
MILKSNCGKRQTNFEKNIDAAEYKHIVLGLIFLRYISDAFEELYEKLQQGEGEYAGADPEDRDEYKAENVFFVPTIARWSYLQSEAKKNQKSVKLLIMQWMPSKKRILCLEGFYQRYMHGAILTLQILAV